MTQDSKPIPLAIKTQDLKLLVISHTEHFLDQKGVAHGWTSTVRELDFLAGHFKQIIHLAVLHPGAPPASTSSYAAHNIKFVSIPPFGGAGIINKLRIFWVLPKLFLLLANLLKQSDLFQFRAPTSIGLFVIPMLTIFYPRKKGWYKYAGNWMQPNMPLSYKLQKWMLEKWQRRPVTINGRWPNQPAHVHTFENPCLNASELSTFSQNVGEKVWKAPYTGCFVGRLDDAKGVQRLVDLLNEPWISEQIGVFHFVGDGPKMEDYHAQLNQSSVRVAFHGFLSRSDTFAIYAQSHLFFLPSNSEGFPKVVAEAAAFGCVPIVSNVSSIGQYINEENGFLWNVTGKEFKTFVKDCDLAGDELERKAKNITTLAESFTFEHFFERLFQLIKTL